MTDTQYECNECKEWYPTPQETRDCIMSHVNPKPDIVNHPQHYTFGKIEVLDAIEDWQLDYHQGNIVKYIVRSDYKDNRLQDLKKAKFYLDRYIKLVEESENGND